MAWFLGNCIQTAEWIAMNVGVHIYVPLKIHFNKTDVPQISLFHALAGQNNKIKASPVSLTITVFLPS